MKTINLSVEGMMCGHCETRVQDALTKLAGITACKASAQANTVTCTFDEQVQTQTEIIETIEAVGYDVKIS